MNYADSVRTKILDSCEPVTESGCWIWTRCTDQHGYGKTHAFGVAKKAHRLSYELFVGPIPESMHILHRCDVPSCINPAHLRVGTHQENMREMSERKRAPIGSRQGRSKLTEEDVRYIRAEHRAGTINRVALAKKFGIDRSMISHILRRKNWKHI